MRDLAKYAAGIVLAVALLAWVVRDADLGAVWQQLREASLPLIALCVVLNTGHNVFRAWRWRALLAPFRTAVPFRPMFVAIIVGYMTSWIVPGRLGELVRPMLLSARENVPLGPSLGSVVADRMMDALAVVALFAVGAWATPLEGRAAEYAPLIRTGALTIAGVVVGVVVAMMLASRSSGRLDRWLDGKPRLLRWAGRSLVAVASGVEALRSPRLLAVVSIQSLFAWVTIALATWCGILASGVDIGLGPVLVITPLLVLGVAVPTPGGAGSYHGAMKVGLMLFGVPDVQAISAGFLMHLVIVVPTVVLGMLLIWVEGLSLRDLVASASQLRRLGSVPDAGRTQRALENAP
ncbi:MAG TPA: lysylphosphatidylglycerol synthase transmembrane domain-containing protein [Candidatus Polarisedimenticolaceae bacterium]|nr:lysylphosphatidylglycerol synthase transmembrane domain-containing protein [Candidatus Polarisedimenticolaceae bacterium]